MTHIVDTLGLVLVIGGAASYVLMTLGPRAVRQRILDWVSAGLAKLPAVWGVRGLGERVRRAAGKGGAACGGCSSCAANETTPSAEVRVPVARIGRRAAH